MYLANSFMESLQELTQAERGAVFTTVNQLFANPSHPGLSAERLNGRDRNFWSCRVNRDVRIIYHNMNGRILVCYTNHHDQAYAWANNRYIREHPVTGAVQIITSVDVVQPPSPYTYATTPTPQRAIFERYTDRELLLYGVPEDWLPTIRSIDSEDRLLGIIEHLPIEIRDVLLLLAEDRIPAAPVAPITPVNDAIELPSSQISFFSVKNKEDLELAFIDDWQAWMVFLHPEQRRLVTRTYNGPAKIAGSAGTGKTVVALHRAAEMARKHDDIRILLTTISNPLTRALQQKLNTLLIKDRHARERIEVESLHDVALRLYQNVFRQKPVIIDQQSVYQIVSAITQRFQSIIPATLRITPEFMYREWSDIIDAWQIYDFERYRTFARLGRTRRLTMQQREALWVLLNEITNEIRTRQVLTIAQLFQRLTDYYATHSGPYQACIVDECQDVTPYQMRFLAALMRDNPSGLFLTGDIGQQIYQAPYSWLGVGVNIIGRSHVLRVNYRTSQQIRRTADYLVDVIVRDVDGNEENRNNTISVFSGPQPYFIAGATMIEEVNRVADWLRLRLQQPHVHAHEICIIVRSAAQIERARMVAQSVGVAHRVIDERIDIQENSLPIMTMQLAKGLEFRAVIVMACDEQVIPQYESLGSYDAAEIADIQTSERQLLYVACTRAREELVLSYSGTPSMFLLDMRHLPK